MTMFLGVRAHVLITASVFSIALGMVSQAQVAIPSAPGTDDDPALESNISGLEVIALNDHPGPHELAYAKQGLANGAVIVMMGEDVTRFDGLMDVGLERDEGAEVTDEAGTTPESLRLMAARMGSHGVLNSYECYSPNGSKADRHCKNAFQSWVAEEASEANGAGFPEPLSGDWTTLGRLDADYRDIKGDVLQDRIRLYRVNDYNLQHDWYLVVRDPRSIPNFRTCGPTSDPFGFYCYYLTNKRDFQTSLDRSLVSDKGFSLFDWSPANSQGSNASMTIGAGLSGWVPEPNVGFSMTWTQPDVTTTVHTNIPGKEVSWVETFQKPFFGPKTPSNSEPFQSHSGAIFEVPEGTTNFSVRTSSISDSTIYDPVTGNDAVIYRIKESRPVSVSAPVFSATPASVVVLPKGQATLSVNAGVPAYSQGLAWIAAASDGFSVFPDHGVGPNFITVRATTAQVGDVGTIQLQTSPPYAAPSVAQHPLLVSVSVVNRLPPTARGVLLAGGTDWNGQALATAEIWDPATKTVGTPLIMSAARWQHASTALPDGRVLLTGGYDANSIPQSFVEAYNPAVNGFASIRNMNSARAGHTATLFTHGPLAGKVLIVGGCCDLNSKALNSAEIFDPQANTFAATGSMKLARMDHTATLLSDGRVLITGGTDARGSYTGLSQAEIYDPLSRSFTLTGSLNTGRQGHSATLLKNGQVLVVGGWNINQNPLRTAELYTPQSGAFTSTGPLGTALRYQASTLLLDGRALLAGGFNYPISAEYYDPNTATFSFTENFMTEERDFPTSTLLLNTGTPLDGQVLIAGGVVGNTGNTGGKRLELFNPAYATFTPAGQMSTPRTHFTATPLAPAP